MSASLVGSEMCIRDRPRGDPGGTQRGPRGNTGGGHMGNPGGTQAKRRGCLLYTSDAADDM
eukprot:8822056-Alexandrium_andersonii.AAC.1